LKLNALFGNMFSKGMLLLGIVIASMFDIPLAILLTTWLIIVVIQTHKVPHGDKHKHNNNAHNQKHDSHPQAASSAQKKTVHDIANRNVNMIAESKTEINDYDISTEDDKEIMRLAHVSDDTLLRIQTSAIDPQLVGYEEDDVATVDMTTIITPQQH